MKITVPDGTEIHPDEPIKAAEGEFIGYQALAFLDGVKMENVTMAVTGSNGYVMQLDEDQKKFGNVHIEVINK